MLIKIINIFICWPIATYNWDTVNGLKNAHFQINALYVVKILLFKTPLSNERPPV